MTPPTKSENMYGVKVADEVHRFIGYLQSVGFYKEREIAFSHKQAALMKIRKEGWSAPEL